MNQRKAGAVLSYISMGINSIIGFIYIPVLLVFLSKEQYGLYQLVASMIGYLMIMDFGLSNTTTRYYSQYMAKNDEIKKQNLLAITIILYSFVALCIIIIGLIGLNYIIPLYIKTLSSYELETAKQIFVIMLVNIAIVIPGNIFVAVINSHEKFIFARSLNISNIIIQPILVFIVLNFNPSILSLVLIQTFCNIVVVCINIYYCFCKLKIKIKLYFWDNKFIRELLIFSFFIFLPGIISIAYWKTGQIILGALIGTGAVAVYAIAIQFITVFMSFSTAISGVFLPQISAISAKTGDMDQINNIFVKTGRIQFLIMSLILSGFILYGKQFIILWIGYSFVDAYIYALILMSGLFICLVQGVGVPILQAKNKHIFRSIVYFFLGIINICVSIPMAKKYGGLGCAVTTGICLFVGQTVIMNLYFNKIGVNIVHFFKQIISMAVPVFCVFILGYLANIFFVSNLISIFIIKICIFTILFMSAVWKFAMNDYEKNLVLKPLLSFLKEVKII